MNIEEANKVLWKYSKKKATYELQKEKGLSFNDDDYEASVICDYLLELVAYNNYQKEEIERLKNIINRTTKYVESLSSSGRGCDIYDDIKQEILRELKGSDKE